MNSERDPTITLSDAARVLPASEVMPVLRTGGTEDRLQRRETAAAVRLGAGKDRTEPDYSGFEQETT